MALWKIEPTCKKSLYEREYYTKDGNTFMVETGWRWGSFKVTTDDDTPPIIEEGTDLYSCDYEVELIECSDGCWEEHDFDGCDEATKEWLEKFLEEKSAYELEEHGWSYGDTEMILGCEASIEKLD